jgi:hypothetical protein
LPTAFPALDTVAQVNDVILLPGEALLVQADANAAAWTHWVNIDWQEGLPLSR